MNNGWRRKKIGDVLQLEYGKPLPDEDRDEAGSFPVYGANGIKCRTNRSYHDKPSIIVGRKGSAGELTLSEPEFWPLDVTYFVTFDESEYDLMFLYHCLSRLSLPSLANGVKPGINRNHVYEIECWFPPLGEQKRIVGILDEAFAGIAAAVANAEKNLANARELFESHLNAVFTRKGEGWHAAALGDCCTFSSGGTPSKKNEAYWHGEIPWVSGRDMKSDRIGDAALHISKTAVEESATRIAPVGSLLILVRGMGLANGVAVAELVAPCAFNQDIRAIHPCVDLNPRFLLMALRSRFAHDDQILNNAAHGTLKIDMDDLREVRISVPPLTEQRGIVANIDALAADTQRLASVYRRKLEHLAALQQSILHKAFRGPGELTAKAVPSEVV